MGQRGSEWMRAEFGWEGIARRMLAGYEVRGQKTEREVPAGSLAALCPPTSVLANLGSML